MKFNIDADKLKTLRSFDPSTAEKHLGDLKNHQGPGFLKVATAKAVGWSVGLGAEAFLALVVAPATLVIPVVGEVLMPAIEMAAPFAAMKIGHWAEQRTLEWMTNKEQRNEAPVRSVASHSVPKLAAVPA